MTTKKCRSRWQPGAAGRMLGRMRPEALYANFSGIPARCQIGGPVGELITQARAKAWLAGLIWADRREAGDLAGAEFWRRRQLKHQAIERALKEIHGEPTSTP